MKFIKRNLWLIIIFLIQAVSFYLLPYLTLRIRGRMNPLSMVFLLLIITIILSYIVGIFSKNKKIYFYALLVTLVYLPSIRTYYKLIYYLYGLLFLAMSLISIFLGRYSKS